MCHKYHILMIHPIGLVAFKKTFGHGVCYVVHSFFEVSRSPNFHFQIRLFTFIIFKCISFSIIIHANAYLLHEQHEKVNGASMIQSWLRTRFILVFHNGSLLSLEINSFQLKYNSLNYLCFE